MVHPFIHKTITNPDDTKSAEKGIYFQRAARVSTFDICETKWR